MIRDNSGNVVTVARRWMSLVPPRSGERSYDKTVAFLLAYAAAFATALQFAAPAGAQDLSQAEERAFQAAAMSVADSVVQIVTVGGLEKVEGVLANEAPTTGVIVSEDGYIISSSFNFLQEPSAILVSIPHGLEYPAKVVSRDKSRRLVLLKITPKKPLSIPDVVPREDLRVGQWAIAIGKSFHAQAPNISVGILSAKHRIWGRAIQTDAKISPVNYGGPLIDIRGRVMGILVPLSTEDGSEMAGDEMYDSGVGFAVPLNEIQERLATMIDGTDLAPGLLGLTLRSTDLYRGKPVVAATAAKSPAREAGIQRGDQILTINDIGVANQTQLKHVIGPLYAGDAVRLVLLRNGQRQKVELALTDKIEPYEHPFLGILPNRDAKTVALRYVYPNSPAAKAGLETGDQLESLDGDSPENLDDWRLRLSEFEPGDTIEIGFKRKGKPSTSTIQLSHLPEAIPTDVPPPGSEDEVAAEIIAIQLPEEPNQCWAVVPKSYEKNKPHALLVWLAPPNFDDADQLMERWGRLCNARHVIVLAPQPVNADRWLPTEATVIRKLVDSAIRQFTIAPERIVVHGYQSGGSMAYRVALSHRDIIRGVAVVDATLPRGARLSSNDPIEPLAYYLAADKTSPIAKRMQRDAEGLRRIKFPVTERPLGDGQTYLDGDDLTELARWVDTLDRL